LPDNVTAADGHPVWDARKFDFITGEAPATANPSLWRQERLNGVGGLFEVVDGIYQVRNLDLSNISFVRGETGWIVLDPLITAEVAAAALELVNTHVERRPVTAVVYSHSHADHFGGVRGVCSPEDVAAGRVRIVAPEGFTFEAVSENVMAGNAMSRRASYMYGNLLPPSPTGQIGAGLGKTTSTGSFGLLEPTDLIGHAETSLMLDGVELQTMYTPDTEAPAEFVFLLPAWRALWTAEVVTHVQHNLYTLRGAQVRDALGWAKAIDGMIARFGAHTDLLFASHHWPTWGHEEALALLRSQRDTYRYLHDETLRLANHGETMLEIAEQLELPPALAHTWSSGGTTARSTTTSRRSTSATWASSTATPPTSTPTHRAPPPSATWPTWAGPRRSSSAPAPTTRPVTTAGSPRSSSTWCSPIPTTSRPGRCWPTRSPSWATRPSPARGATSSSPAPRNCGTGWSSCRPRRPAPRTWSR
jgi:alkyl sulfatase BDS1-like metallo-beta-lactamase superfamily hydrolase